jgi:hypothetical protein
MSDAPQVETNDRIRARAPRPVLRTGLYTGALLIVVMLGALVAANRIPSLENHALERNAVSYTLFVLFMLIPVARFWNRPLNMFASAMVGWILFVIAFDIAGAVFWNLFESIHHDPFLSLIEGTVIYGLFAVGSWVCEMILHARRHPIMPGRKPGPIAGRHPR